MGFLPLTASMELPSFNRLPQFIRSRRFMVLCIFSGTALAVSAIAGLSYRAARGFMLNNLKQQALSEIYQGRAEIDQWLAVRKAEVQMLANNPMVRTLNWSVIEPYYRSELQFNSEFHLFSMAPANGWNHNTAKGQTGIQVKDREWFINGMAGKVSVANPILSRTTGVTQINVSAPIQTASNRQTIGVVSGAIPINRVVDVVKKLQYGPGSYAFALNSVGIPISHPDEELIGTPERPAPSFLRSSDTELAALAHHMVTRQEGIELIRIDNQWQYVAYTPHKEANWSLALVIPRQNIERHLDTLNFLATVMGALLVVAIIGVWRQVESYESSYMRAAQEALLNRLTTRIRHSLDLPTILQTTVTELASLKHLDQVLFGWYQPQAHCFNLVYRSPATAEDRTVSFTYEPSFDFVLALANGECVHLNPKDEPAKSPLQLRAGHYLALALPAQEGGSGYLITSYSHRLSQTDQELLQAVADQLAIAVRQADLYSQTQTQVQLLNQTLVQLQEAQTHLVQSEKMSSLGQLVAGIAHEINNPVSFIYGNLPHAEEYTQDLLKLIQLYQKECLNLSPTLKQQTEELDLEFLSEDLPKLLASMRGGACRIREIVDSLRTFSRLDEAEVKDADIHEGINSTLMILQSRLKREPAQSAIEVSRHYGDLPKVECYAGQLNQVFMNLLSNAIDAIEAEIAQGRQIIPAISIHTAAIDNTWVRIQIKDNGIGIPEEIKQQIFDPFFTTKPVGSGTGLGLAISYQIIERHHGSLTFTSKIGQGTEFVIQVPLRQNLRISTESNDEVSL